MAKFITLTMAFRDSNRDSSELTICIDSIESFIRMYSDLKDGEGEKNFTRLYIKGKDSMFFYDVVETPSWIIRLINKAENVK